MHKRRDTGAMVIETAYDGHLFRSRLEARWATFFNTLHIPYSYEPEGFELDGLRYLPDFWLPKQSCWVEIKGEEPTEEEQEKMRRVVEVTQHPGFIFYGNIAVPDVHHIPTDSAIRISPSGWDNGYWWCECAWCHSLGICFNGRSDRLPCKAACQKTCHGDKGYNYNTPRLVAAYTAARSARFERWNNPPYLPKRTQ